MKLTSAPRAFLSAMALILAMAQPLGARVKNPDDAIRSLDAHLGRIESYRQHGDSVIASAKKRIASDKAGEEFLKIGDLYRKNNVDSALAYYFDGMKRAEGRDKRNYYALKLALCSLAPVNGVVKEAIEMFAGVSPDSLPAAMRPRYYEAGNDLYYYSAHTYSSDTIRTRYLEAANNFSQHLIDELPDTSLTRRFHAAQLDLYRHGSDEALSQLVALLDSVPVTSNLYGRIAADIAEHYNSMPGRDDDRIYYLALAASSDVINGTREATALHLLGEALFKKGDLDHAYRYTATALDLAVNGNVRLRATESALTVPMIAKAYRDRSERRRNWVLVLSAVLLAILLALLAALAHSRRERKRLYRLRKHLSEVNDLKDAYIRRVLLISGIYLDALEDFRKLARRKLKAAQYNDLYTILESGRTIHESTDQACAVFDEAFLSVYPGFVDGLNSLLHPEACYRLPAPNRLNAELRIAAFLRLGIDSAEKMAKFMGLSVASVYTYRNKMRSRAVDRDNFEADLRHIGRSGA